MTTRLLFLSTTALLASAILACSSEKKTVEASYSLEAGVGDASAQDSEEQSSEPAKKDSSATQPALADDSANGSQAQPQPRTTPNDAGATPDTAAVADAAADDKPILAGDAGMATDAQVLTPIRDLDANVAFVGEGVPCGEAVCQDVQVNLAGQSLPVTGCCADEAVGKCGLQMDEFASIVGLAQAGCEPLEDPGTSDPTCGESEPVQSVLAPGQGFIFDGCCQASGKCGYAANIMGLGFGCVSPTRFGREEGAACGN